MGYQNKALNYGANSFVAGTFLPIGKDVADVTLSDFTVTDGENGWQYDSDWVGTLKVNGTIDKQYTYVTPFMASEEVLDDEDLIGWWDMLDARYETFEKGKMDTVKIPFGTGLCAYTSKNGVSITFAGEVLADDYGIPLNYGANTFTGIVCPADVVLGQLEVTDGENGWQYDSDWLGTLKVNGTIDKQYTCVTPFMASEEVLDDEELIGWWDMLDARYETFEKGKMDDTPFAAGLGLCVYTSKNGVELVIPSAIP